MIYGRAGTVIPLAGRTKADRLGTRWLAPAFPLDYVVALVELVQLAVDVDVPRTAMTGAIDLIQSWRLPEGGDRVVRAGKWGTWGVTTGVSRPTSTNCLFVRHGSWPWRACR